MELYGEQGFEQTTVAQIAARAGLTERTFFRHFADKREVLFAGSEELQAGRASRAARGRCRVGGCGPANLPAAPDRASSRVTA
jgi:AcrR family transcriptional regulator